MSPILAPAMDDISMFPNEPRCRPTLAPSKVYVDLTIGTMSPGDGFFSGGLLFLQR